MTKIRLARTGSTHQPHYRVIVTDSRQPRDGRFVEILGSYHPLDNGVTINAERAAYWISVGAQPTNTVISLLTRAGVKHSFTVRRKPERAKAEAEAPAADEVAEPVNPEATDEADAAVEENPVSDQAAVAEAETPAEAVETPAEA